MLDGGGDRGQNLAQPLHLPAGRITSTPTAPGRRRPGSPRTGAPPCGAARPRHTDAVGRLAQDPIRDPYPTPLPCQRARQARSDSTRPGKPRFQLEPQPADRGQVLSLPADYRPPTTDHRPGVIVEAGEPQPLAGGTNHMPPGVAWRPAKPAAPAAPPAKHVSGPQVCPRQLRPRPKVPPRHPVGTHGAGPLWFGPVATTGADDWSDRI